MLLQLGSPTHEEVSYFWGSVACRNCWFLAFPQAGCSSGLTLPALSCALTWTPSIFWSIPCSCPVTCRSAFSLSLNFSPRLTHGPVSQDLSESVLLWKLVYNRRHHNYDPGCRGLVKYFGLEGTSGEHLVQAPAQSRSSYEEICNETATAGSAVAPRNSPSGKPFRTPLDTVWTAWSSPLEQKSWTR